jgi:peptidoglycan hydrolase FlgJ
MDPVTTAKPHSLPAAPTDAATRTAAEEFEAVFIASFLGPMLDQARPTTLGGGAGEQMFSSLLADHIAREIARSGGIGLAQSVAAQLDAYRR